MIKIPLTTAPSQTFSINLDDVIYDFKIMYNTREETWAADISSANFSLSGISLVGGADILRQHPGPLSNFYMINTDGTGLDAASDNLGVDVILIVSSDAEIQEIISNG